MITNSDLMGSQMYMQWFSELWQKSQKERNRVRVDLIAAMLDCSWFDAVEIFIVVLS